MKSILITGGTGLIGKKLISKLKKKRYNIYVLTRRGSYIEDNVNYLEWDPKNSKLDIKGINNLFSIIHLAGESINGSRWTKSYKKKILDSRVDTTKLLFKTIKRLKLKPKSFISASATGYYRADTNSTQMESDPQGTGFLSGVVKKWEDEVLKFNNINVNTTVLRIGLVLSKEGGILKSLYPIFKLCLGVTVGTGKQVMSWIHEDDMINIIIKGVEDNKFKGIYNCVAPEKVSNQKFTIALAKTLGRFRYPKFFKVPSFVIRLLFGGQSVLILNGLNVSSKKIINSNFKFKYSKLMPALRSLYN